jgi:hypothetical protein
MPIRISIGVWINLVEHREEMLAMRRRRLKQYWNRRRELSECRVKQNK